MTITSDILPILRCPAGGGPLTLADGELIERVNAQITAGLARDQLDATVEAPIEGGLVSETGARLYPIRNGIPTLIAEDAIRLSESNLITG